MNEPTFFEAVSQTPLLQRAVVAGALAGVCCASLSPLVVLRRMAFVGDGMAHAAFGGIGLALFMLSGARYDDISVQLITIGFCLVLGVAIGKVSRRADGKLAEDSAIGVAFSVSMALGAMLIRLREKRQDAQFVPPMDVYLFGSILNISNNDIYVLAGVTLAVLAVLVIFQKEILFYTFDARLAEVSGLNVGLLHYLFLLLLILTVVVSSRVMGIVLVSASLVLPGVIALKLSNRLIPAMLLAALVGIISFEAGLYASYVYEVHSGSAIILSQFLLLIVAYAISFARKTAPHPIPAAPPS
jgi:ABC-type Mn2+/Zn2+ transport system permease subunit